MLRSDQARWLPFRSPCLWTEFRGAEMISLAGRDILHSWGKFVFTGMGLGPLIGVAKAANVTYLTM